MEILLAFNQSDLHTFTSLSQYTQLGEGELMMCLQSLVDCKLLVLGEQCEVGVVYFIMDDVIMM